MTSIDILLDAGATGLGFFATFLPRVVDAGAVPTATAQDLTAVYDQQRGMQTDVLTQNADSLFSCAAVMRDSASGQRAAAATLAAGWTGADASAAGQLFSTGLDRADDCVGAVERTAEALRSAAAGLVDVISQKSDTAAQFDRPDACGRTASQVDATIAAAQMRSPTPEQHTELATLCPGVVTAPDASGSGMNPTELILASAQCSSWLATEFVPYMADRVTAFRDMCAHTDIAVRAVFDAVGAAFTAFDGISFPLPDIDATDCSCEPPATAPVGTSPAAAGTPVTTPAPEGSRPGEQQPPPGPAPAMGPAETRLDTEQPADDCIDDTGEGSGDGRDDDTDLVRAAVRVADAITGALGGALADVATAPTPDPAPDAVSDGGPVPVDHGPAPAPAGTQPAPAGSERGHLEAELDGYGARVALSDKGSLTLSLTDPHAGTRDFTLGIGPNGLPVLDDATPIPEPEPEPEPEAAVPPPSDVVAPQSVPETESGPTTEPDTAGPPPLPTPPPGPPPTPAECVPGEPDLAAAGEDTPSPAAPDLAVPDLAEAGNL